MRLRDYERKELREISRVIWPITPAHGYCVTQHDQLEFASHSPRPSPNFPPSVPSAFEPKIFSLLPVPSGPTAVPGRMGYTSELKVYLMIRLIGMRMTVRHMLGEEWVE